MYYIKIDVSEYKVCVSKNKHYKIYSDIIRFLSHASNLIANIYNAEKLDNVYFCLLKASNYLSN